MDDDSTAALMKQAYHHLAAGCAMPQALRHAMLRLARPLRSFDHEAPQEQSKDADAEPVSEKETCAQDGRWLGGFKKVEGGESRSEGDCGMVPAVQSFLDMLQGGMLVSSGGSRDASEWVAIQRESPAFVVEEDEGERREYWRQFCLGKVAPTCVIDFPYADEGGLDLPKEPVDERLLERLYCFEDYEDDTHLAVGGRRRRVILKVHTLLKWRERGDKLFLRASKITSAKVVYAHWNAAKWNEAQRKHGCYEMESGHLKLVPVDAVLQRTWQTSYRQGRRADMEWEWRKPGSIPAAEDQSSDEVGRAYNEVRAAIALGESLFPRGATSADKAMKGHHRVWAETHGVYQTNKMLRDGREVEYEAFADGFPLKWRRPLYWAGFLVMGASTRLPSPQDAAPTADSALDSSGAESKKVKDMSVTNGQTGMEVESWTCDDVMGHVRGLTEEFGDHSRIYAQKMKDEHIDGKVLLELSETDLKELGFSLGHRKKFLARIEGFRGRAHL